MEKATQQNPIQFNSFIVVVTSLLSSFSFFAPCNITVALNSMMSPYNKSIIVKN